ncbi:hypothetical protein NLG97_g7253 [Lecanicillium saksenae]|uniref:Uncharacterized protein n=1 Tax=Lecanicillium saksenae TaxID=468837 RepID=A0ACC1QP05_9HYPO|nr:hypothetical protein NLG97_g7253 [Lecanicillium saksenae]
MSDKIESITPGVSVADPTTTTTATATTATTAAAAAAATTELDDDMLELLNKFPELSADDALESRREFPPPPPVYIRPFTGRKYPDSWKDNPDDPQSVRDNVKRDWVEIEKKWAARGIPSAKLWTKEKLLEEAGEAQQSASGASADRSTATCFGFNHVTVQFTVGHGMEDKAAKTDDAFVTFPKVVGVAKRYRKYIHKDEFKEYLDAGWELQDDSEAQSEWEKKRTDTREIPTDLQDFPNAESDDILAPTPEKTDEYYESCLAPVVFNDENGEPVMTVPAYFTVEQLRRADQQLEAEGSVAEKRDPARSSAKANEN